MKRAGAGRDLNIALCLGSSGVGAWEGGGGGGLILMLELALFCLSVCLSVYLPIYIYISVYIYRVEQHPQLPVITSHLHRADAKTVKLFFDGSSVLS